MPYRRPSLRRHSPLLYGDKLSMWLDAEDQGTFSFATGISAWRDKGPFGWHQTQATGAAQPTLAAGALNGKPGVRFASQHLFGATSLTGTAYTVFVVARLKSDAVSNGRAICFAPTGVAEVSANGWVPLRRSTTIESVAVVTGTVQRTDIAVTYNTAFLHGTVYGGGTLSSRVNGGTETTTAISPATNVQRCAIGTGLNTAVPTTLWWSDDIYEIVIIAAALTEAERQREEGRLAHKWGMQGLLPAAHAWKSVRP